MFITNPNILEELYGYYQIAHFGETVESLDNKKGLELLAIC